jgi:alkanesulfonate monooxygenase SsuD/methylene tetrahydromethanopterin reductase-like flavin-dependent oxidoreductase (luciferase family)
MKVSMLCGAHYEGAAAHLNAPPVAPAICDPATAKQSFDHFLEYAAMADELGFDWISVSEHHSSPLILSSSIMPLAGALTQIVKRARIALLGPLAPISNPVRIAEEIAVLDQLSNGRLVILPLRGTPNEFNVYVPVEGSKTQSMTQEASRLIRKALSEPEPFAWEGEHYSFPRVAVWPRTIQRPHPPMYFSGNSMNSAVFAGRDHLGLCLSFHQPSVVADTVAKYRSEAAHAGWEPTADDIVYRGFAVVADSDEKAAEIESTFLPAPLRFLLKGPVPGPTDAFGAPGAAPADNGHGPNAGPVPYGVGRMLFSGSPETVAQQIREFHEATGVGVIDIVFSSGQNPPADIRRSIELFGREVLPLIRDVGAAPRTLSAAGGRP